MSATEVAAAVVTPATTIEKTAELNKKGKGKARKTTVAKIRTCETCGKQFQKFSHFNRHLQTHTNDKPFACSLCGSKWRRSDDLKVHLRTHTGERPYKCKTCGKKYKTSSHLRQHERTHSDAAHSYVCPLCWKRFSSKNGLTQHLHVHRSKAEQGATQCPQNVKPSQSEATNVTKGETDKSGPCIVWTTQQKDDGGLVYTPWVVQPGGQATPLQGMVQAKKSTQLLFCTSPQACAPQVKPENGEQPTVSAAMGSTDTTAICSLSDEVSSQRRPFSPSPVCEVSRKEQLGKLLETLSAQDK
eukprot:m.37834 g.37834  ORF g.37834 m.37834 type:complete len:300 (+) comp9357_c0_seq1:372-1271(+)